MVATGICLGSQVRVRQGASDASGNACSDDEEQREV